MLKSSLFLLSLLYLISLSLSATITWSGGGGNNLWSTPANWVGGVAPVNADTVIFTPTAAITVNVDVNRNLAQLTVNAAANTLTMQLNGNLQGPMTFNANVNFPNNGGNLVIQGGTCGALCQFNLGGGGQLFFTTAPFTTTATGQFNLFQGTPATVQNTGSLVFSTGSTAQILDNISVGGGTTSITNAGTITFGNSQVQPPVTSTGSIQFKNGATTQFTSLLTQNGNLAVTQGGTVQFQDFITAGTNTFSAGTIQFQGATTISLGGSVLVSGGAQVTINSLALAGSLTTTGGGQLQVTGTANLNSGSTVNLGSTSQAVFSGTSNLNTNITGTGSIQWQGTTNIGSSVIFSLACDFQNAVNVAPGQSVIFNGPITHSGGVFTIPTTSTVTFNSIATHTLTFVNIIAGTGNIVISSTGQWTISTASATTVSPNVVMNGIALFSGTGNILMSGLMTTTGFISVLAFVSFSNTVAINGPSVSGTGTFQTSGSTTFNSATSISCTFRALGAVSIASGAADFFGQLFIQTPGSLSVTSQMIVRSNFNIDQGISGTGLLTTNAGSTTTFNVPTSATIAPRMNINGVLTFSSGSVNFLNYVNLGSSSVFTIAQASTITISNQLIIGASLYGNGQIIFASGSTVTTSIPIGQTVVFNPKAQVNGGFNHGIGSLTFSDVTVVSNTAVLSLGAQGSMLFLNQFNCSSTISGAGSINVGNGATSSIFGTITMGPSFTTFGPLSIPSGTVTFNTLNLMQSSSFDFAGNVQINGNAQIYPTVMTGVGTLFGGASSMVSFMNGITTSNTINTSGKISLLNTNTLNGALTVQSLGSLTLGSNGVLNLNGISIIQDFADLTIGNLANVLTGASFTYSSKNPLNIASSSSLTVTKPFVLSQNISGSGSLTISNTGSLTSSGNVVIQNPTTLNGPTTYTGSLFLNGVASIKNAISTTDVNSNLNIIGTSTLDYTAATAISGGSVNVAGTLNWNSGTMSVASLSNTGILNLIGGISLQGILNNAGTISSSSSSDLTIQTLNNTVNGVFNMNGVGKLTGGAHTSLGTFNTITTSNTVQITSAFVNRGVFNVNGGQLCILPTNFKQDATGSLIVSNSQIQSFPYGAPLTLGGILSGSGQITANLTTNMVNLDQGNFTVFGDWNVPLNGVLNYQLSTTTGNAQMNVSGNVVFLGSVQVKISPAYRASYSDVVTLINWGNTSTILRPQTVNITGGAQDQTIGVNSDVNGMKYVISIYNSKSLYDAYVASVVGPIAVLFSVFFVAFIIAMIALLIILACYCKNKMHGINAQKEMKEISVDQSRTI